MTHHCSKILYGIISVLMVLTRAHHAQRTGEAGFPEGVGSSATLLAAWAGPISPPAGMPLRTFVNATTRKASARGSIRA